MNVLTNTIRGRNRRTASSLTTTLAAFLTTGTAAFATGPCTKGGCANVVDSPCWKIVSQQCTATPGHPTFTQGPAVFIGVGDSVDCNACQLDEGEGVILIAVGQETGLEFCVNLEAGVTFSAGASLCGTGFSGGAAATVGAEICVNTKRWVEHEVICRCPAGSLVHCRTITELVPIRVTVPVAYDLTTCYALRDPAGSPRCDRPANGMTGFTQTVHCGTGLKRAADTRLKVTAAFATGRCTPPVDADKPVQSKPEG